MAASRDHLPLSVYPIGYMRSVFLFKNGTPRQPSLCTSARGSLTIMKTIFNNPEHSLEGLEQFSHVWIIFIFHQNNNLHTKAKVKPPRLNGKRVGVFSTRSPYRPNAIGLTLAKIEKISGSSIDFSGIDLVDGTPVLDIKPYIPQYDLPVGFRGIPASQHSPTYAGEAEWSVDMHHHPLLYSTSYDVKNEGKPMSYPSSLPLTMTTNTVAVEGSTEGSKTEVFDSLGAEPDTHSDATARSLMLTYGDSCPSHDCKIAAVEDKREKCYFKETIGSQVSELKREQCCLTSMTKSGLHDDVEGSSYVMHSPPFSGISKCFSRHLMPSHADDRLPICEQATVATLKVGPNSASCGAEQMECKVVPDGSKNTSITRDTTHTDPVFIANWLSSPPVSKLRVSFTEKAEADLKLFSQQEPEGTQTEYKLEFFSEESEIRGAIVSILQEDPRSVYRREKCHDALYFFTVDRIHITCSFDGDHVKVLKLQPITWAEKLKERPLKL